MVRLSIFAVCLVAAFVINFVECSNESFNSHIEVNYVKNLTEFLRENPGIKLAALNKEVKSNGPSTRIQIVHRLGNRISGNLFSLISNIHVRVFAAFRLGLRSSTFFPSSFSPFIFFPKLVSHEIIIRNIKLAVLLSNAIKQLKI